jgi:prepilin-type processing-associated H-X9-DG protein
VAAGGILTGLLVPDLAQTKSKLLENACLANLKQWGMINQLYAEDYRGVTFSDDNWANYNSALNSYWGTLPSNAAKLARVCPAVAVNYSLNDIIVAGVVPPGYSMTRPNGNYANGSYVILPGRFYVRLAGIPRPDEYALMFDSDGTFHVSSADFFSHMVNVTNRHQGVINVLFADMHVQSVTSAFCQTQSIAGTHSPWFASENPTNSSFVIQYY